MSAAHASMPLIRSHRMPLSLGKGGGEGDSGGAVGATAAEDPPVLALDGLAGSLGEAGGGGGGDPGFPRGAFGGGDPGVGWILRAPVAPTEHGFGAHSSTGVDGATGGAGGRIGDPHLRPFSATAVGGFVGQGAGRSTTPAEDEDEDGEEEGEAVERGELGGGQTCGRGGLVDRRGSMMEGGGEGAIVPAQTPRVSPADGMSAAMHRAHALSSVARRMDRLKIRSPDVETHAAEV